MSLASKRFLAILLPASGFALCFAMAARADAVQTLPVDKPTQVDGVRAACTGIGNREEDESRWSNYPLKIEAVGGYGQWLGNQQVTLRNQGDGRVLEVRCAGPWVLMGVQPGRYDATVKVPNAPAKQVNIMVPANGQRDVIVRFHSLTNGSENRPSGS